MTKILVIPDTQAKAGVCTDHLEALGNYIVEKRPDVIIHIGDHYDMESLSLYSSRKEQEGKRVIQDIKAGQEAMERLLKPLWRLQRSQKRNKKKQYRPRMIFTLGNHEERLKRYIDSNPNMDGILEYPESFQLDRYGWDVYDFKQIVEIDGFLFSHFFYQQNTGRPLGGTCHTKLKNVKRSFVQGHVQGLDIATTSGHDGQKYWGIVAGSYYMHDEGYKGPQANDHWRGVVMLHNVNNGDCAPCVVNMDYLLENYL
jgi:hypothetical protein